METQLVTNSLIKNLHCSSCGTEYSAYDLTDYAHCCDKPLLIEYHLDSSLEGRLPCGVIMKCFPFLIRQTELV